jgi:hypothetical protein
MRVHLVGAQSLARSFREQGHTVSAGHPLPPDADVYILSSGDETMRHLDRGLVVLDLRNGVDLAAAWPAYADLCLVADEAARDTLAQAAGCEPERVFVAGDDDAVIALAGQAWSDTLPPAAVEKRGDLLPQETPPAPLPELEALAVRLEALERQADVMQRDYQVRSRLPLVGPLVAWVRRNLTSHLREPYLDPTLERQVRLNRELVALLRDLVGRQAALEARIEEGEHTGDE